VRKFLISQALLLGCAALTAPAIAAALSGVEMSYVDHSVAPGDDFEAYANGGWRKTAEIPADRADTGVSYEVFQKAEKRTADIIQGDGASHPAAGTEARKIADYYAAYLDTAAIDRKGMTPIKPELDAIAAIRDKAALSAKLGATMRADTDPINATHFWTENLFGLFVTQDLQRPTVTVPYLMQGGLGLPDRD
jgi:putative endopeptidase